MINVNAVRCVLVAGVTALSVTVAAARGVYAGADTSHLAAQKMVAAVLTSAQADARQAAAVAHGQANTVLANPYVEQKVTTPETVGVNATRIPAGGSNRSAGLDHRRPQARGSRMPTCAARVPAAQSRALHDHARGQRGGMIPKVRRRYPGTERR